MTVLQKFIFTHVKTVSYPSEKLFTISSLKELKEKNR